MGLQKFRKNILNTKHILEFSAVLVFPDSSITLDTYMPNLDIRVSKLDIRMSRLDIRVSIPTMLVLCIDTTFIFCFSLICKLCQLKFTIISEWLLGL